MEVQNIERSNANDICNRLNSDFHMELPHMSFVHLMGTLSLPHHLVRTQVRQRVFYTIERGVIETYTIKKVVKRKLKERV